MTAKTKGTKQGVRPTGWCAVCGYEGKLDRFGGIAWHKTRRVGSGGQMYVAKENCSGSGEQSMEMP